MASALINVMSDAAVKASKGLLRDFGEVDQLQVSRKGTSNFVTESDKRAEQVLMRELNKARPGYGFLVEESGQIEGENKEYRWIIDPLDGTHNFIHAIPYFCISIALEKTYPNGDKEVIAGVIYDPIHNDMYTAEKGQGAYVNDNRRLFVSKRDNYEEAMVVISSPHSSYDTLFTGQKLLDALVRSHTSVRYLGASALDLAQVAAGRFDAVCLLCQQPWDVAAGNLMIKEAGGMLDGIDGNEYKECEGSLLATNGVIRSQMLKLLAQLRGS